MKKTIIKNAKIVNRSRIIEGDLLIAGDRIDKVGGVIDSKGIAKEIDGTDKYLIPGVIDDQVHFREPGLTHKANIASESRAAVAGGVTTFMEMPNTKPQALTQELLQDKYDIADECSPANYSFYMGASNDNLEEVLKTDRTNVCGVKIFMGSSTGNMLVDNTKTLEQLFSNVDMLIATHCEDEETVRTRRQNIIDQHGENIDARFHPIIRNTDACYISSSKAVEMAKKFDTRLHILHISTAKEIELFRNDIAREKKRITSEVCVHHLFFEDSMYERLGNKMICNPAIKSLEDRQQLRAALRAGNFDVIATDHAPHTMEEKSKAYLKAPSGLPLVQHSLNLMLEIDKAENYGLPFIVDKMSHAVADIFHIKDRGYLDEGKFADLVLVDPAKKWKVNASNVLYKCGWSPLDQHEFDAKVLKTFVNGVEVYDGESVCAVNAGKRLSFSH